jgi:poly(A) polymerase
MCYVRYMDIKLKALLLAADPVSEFQAIKAKGQLGDLEKTLEALDMKVPAGYHHKDNWKHSLEVLQNAIDREENGPDLILRTAALFHDIGKPATREFGAKGLVTFTNHDVVGSKIVRKVLPRHGFSASDVEKIARLVFMHMRSHTFANGWTDSATRRLITDAGSVEQLEKLIIIFYADTTTKIPGKKNNLHSKVRALTENLERVKVEDARRALRPALNGLEVAEILGITPGRELGEVMKKLNSDENIRLTRDEAITLLKAGKL